MGRPDLCEAYMGKFPVVSLSLKDVDARDCEMAFAMAARRVNEEAGQTLHYITWHVLPDGWLQTHKPADG